MPKPTPIPRMLSLDRSKKLAKVQFKGEQRDLPFTEFGKDSFFIQGFAASFEAGLRVWRATVTFKETSSGVFKYWETEILSFNPGGGAQPRVIGFFDDTNPKDRGTRQGSGPRRDWPASG